MTSIEDKETNVENIVYKQSQPLRIESTEFACLITTRCINSKLWFIDMPQPFLDRTLGFLAKYIKKYNVKLYSFVIFGNHYHLLAHFNEPNRAQFMRDLNARISEGARMFIEEFEGGPLFERRFSSEIVPLESDLEDRFIYCANQSVRAGLTQNPRECISYNSYHDSVNEIVKTYKVVNWSKYRSAKRNNPYISIENYTEYHELKYSRIPGYEDLSKCEFRERLLKLISLDIQAITKERNYSGKGFLPCSKLKKTVRGSKPRSTKKSGRYSKRPLVLTNCRKTRKQILDWFFSIYFEFKRVCFEFIGGRLNVQFPKGTYRPQAFKSIESACRCFN